MFFTIGRMKHGGENFDVITKAVLIDNSLKMPILSLCSISRNLILNWDLKIKRL